jgi:signal transduction histidine kinase
LFSFGVTDLFAHPQYNLAELNKIWEQGIISEYSSAKKCLQILENNRQFLSESLKAKANYLRLIVINSDSSRINELHRKMFNPPDSLNYIDGLIFSTRKYLEKSMPDKAVPLIISALGQLPAGTEKADHLMIELGEAYRQKREYGKGIEILTDLLHKKESVSDINRAYAQNRIAALYNEWGNPQGLFADSVLKYSYLCQDLSEKIKSTENLAFSQNELSVQLSRKGQYAEALKLSQEAVANFKSKGLKFSAINALINQSNIYIGMQEYQLARLAITYATNLCNIEENRNAFMRLYNQYSKISRLTGNYQDAYDFLYVSNLLQQFYYNDRINLQISEQAAKFDLLLKEQKLIEEKQKSEFRQKQVIFLFIITVVLILSLFLSVFYLRLRRRDFMKQKLIEAVFETEENERKRIARDLHDGLGPVLSAVNHYFQAYVDAEPPEKETIRARLQQVLSGSIDEVSRIAHNISPFVLDNYGLIAALNDFIALISDGNKINIRFKYDFTDRFDKNKELLVYRCIFEMIHNTLKHADADIISLNIYTRDELLYINYSDNGKGFNYEGENMKGMGLNNIRNRVESFEGKMNLESSGNSGTRIILEIPIKTTHGKN